MKGLISNSFLKKRFFYFSSNLDLSGMSFGKKISEMEKFSGKHYDVAIIGGGSGGLSCAYECASFGLKTAVFDYVVPTVHGSKWGLGGTCVNVGCIPKKLMHTASIHKENIMRAYDYGFDLGINNYTYQKGEIPFDWNRLVKNVQTHIKSINFGLKSKCNEDQIDYINAIASFQNNNTLVFSNKKSDIHKFIETQVAMAELGKITADNIVIAPGGRPIVPDNDECLNCSELAITSDDIFMLKKPPGKTLIVGASYIALETAGFLAGMGYQVKIMVRRTFLRGFDRSSSDMIVEDLIRTKNVEIIEDSIPHEMHKTSDGQIKVIHKNYKTNEISGQENYDTVVMAIGRKGETSTLNLDSIGLDYSLSNGKIIGSEIEKEKTNVNNVYAVGDILKGVMELTPLAIKAGRLLAKRIKLRTESRFDEAEKYFLNYNQIPTAIFTPLEYSCVGLTEEEAIETYKIENLSIFHSKSIPLEESLYKETDQNGELLRRKNYCKLICLQSDLKVIGIHYLGPNAGEIMQMLGVALKMGLTKYDLDNTIGIHPTIAEQFVFLAREKTKGESADKSSC